MPIYKHVCMHACMYYVEIEYVDIAVSMHVCMYAFMYVYIQPCLYEYMYVYR